MLIRLCATFGQLQLRQEGPLHELGDVLLLQVGLLLQIVVYLCHLVLEDSLLLHLLDCCVQKIANGSKASNHTAQLTIGLRLFLLICRLFLLLLRSTPSFPFFDPYRVLAHPSLPVHLLYASSPHVPQPAHRRGFSLVLRSLQTSVDALSD